MTTDREGDRNVEVLFDPKKDLYKMNNLLGTNPNRNEYEKKAEELRLKLVSYLKDVNYPLVEGMENRVLIREE